MRKSRTSSPSAPGVYVSTSGNNSNNGSSPSQAWQTLARVQTYIDGGMTDNLPIFLKKGDTFTPPAGGLRFHGTSPAIGVALKAYGTGAAPIINGGNGTAVLIDNISNITVQGIETVGSGVAPDGSNTLTENTAGIHVLVSAGTTQGGYVFDHCTCHGHWYGIATGNLTSHTGRVDGLTLTNCTLYGNGGGCGNLWDVVLYLNDGTVNLTVANNLVYNNYGLGNRSQADNGSFGNGIYWNNNNNDANSNVVIYSNCVHDNAISTSGPGFTLIGMVGILLWGFTGYRIYSNEVYHQYAVSSLGDGEGIDNGVATGDGVTEWNYSHDNQGSGLSNADNSFDGLGNRIWRYNVMANNSLTNQLGDFTVLEKGTSQVLYDYCHNNTIYNDTGNSAFLMRIGHNFIRIANNVLISRNNAGAFINCGATGTKVLQNLYDTDGAFRCDVNNVTATTLASFRDLGGETDSGVSYGIQAASALLNPTDPGPTFPVTGVTNFDPTATSPTRRAGLDVNAKWGISAGTLDFHGNPLTTGGDYDIGAVQYQTISNPKPYNPTATCGVTGAVTVGWSYAPNCTWNLYYRTPSGSGSYSLLAGGLAANTHTFSTLSTGDTADFKVRAVRSAVESADSDVVSVTVTSITSSLVSYYNFDEAASPAVDHKSGFNLTWQGGPSRMAGLGGGQFALALARASSQSADRAAEAGMKVFGTGYTEAYWVNTASSPTQTLLHGLNCSNNCMIRYSSGATQLDSSVDFYTSDVQYFFTPPIATWMFLVIVYDPSNVTVADRMRMYVNGARVGAVAGTIPASFASGSTNFTVGNGPYGFLDGAVGPLGLWTRSLSAAEITFLYNGGTSFKLYADL